MLQQLHDILVQFADSVDLVTDEIYVSAENLSSILEGCSQSMGNLADLFSTAKTIEDITPIEMANVFKPYNDIKRSYTSEYVRMVFRKYGKTNVSDSDISNYFVIRNYLVSKGHDESWIDDRIEMIFEHRLFDDIAITGRFSSADQDKCLKYLEEEIRNSDAETFKYRYVIDRLLKNEKIDTQMMNAYMDMLAEKGMDVSKITENDIYGYCKVTDRMRELGMTDKQIYDYRTLVYGESELASLKEAFERDGASAKSNTDSLIKNVLVNRFVDIRFTTNRENDLLYQLTDALKANQSTEQMASLMNRMEVIKDGEVDKLDFAIDLCKATLGINEVSYENSFINEEYAPFDKSGVYWCAMYVTWILSQSDFLDGSDYWGGATPDIAVEWRTDKGKSWAGCSNMKGSLGARYVEKENYFPNNGDLIFFDQGIENFHHVGIVVGVDIENNIIYTIEGKNGSTDPHAVNLQAYKPDYYDIHGYVRMNGTRQDMSDIQDILDKCQPILQND